MYTWLFSFFLLISFHMVFVQEARTICRECAQTGCVMTLMGAASKSLEWTLLIARPISMNETVNSICTQVWWPTGMEVAIPREACPQAFHNISTLFLGLSCCITITSILGDRCVHCMHSSQPDE